MLCLVNIKNEINVTMDLSIQVEQITSTRKEQRHKEHLMCALEKGVIMCVEDK